MPAAEGQGPPLAVSVSIVIPLFNEEGAAAQVVRQLQRALGDAHLSHEIVAVQNGSTDGTGPALRALAEEYHELRIVEVPVNRGFGHGILQGLAVAGGEWVGFMPGDGQVDARVVPRILEKMQEQGAVLGKGRRVVRHDGRRRRFVSGVYNWVMRCLFGLPAEDVNGHPKIMARWAYEMLDLRSRDSFIDAEILLKAQRLRMNVCDVPIEFLPRPAGRSTVGWRTCLEFVANLARVRLQGRDPWGINRLRTGAPPSPAGISSGQEA